MILIPSEKAAPDPSYSPARSRILLIDDDDAIRHLLRTALQTLGHQVVEAENGEEGLAWHAREGFDLVITDLIMPEKEGMETIIELIGRDPDTRIIAISGGGHAPADAYLHIARKVGARQVLTKPFTQQELASAITAALA